MSWWNKLFTGSQDESRVDYYQEGLDLLADSKFHEALTSFRLALKDAPGDPVVLQQIAIAYTRIGMTEEAAKTYRHVLKNQPDAPGAHYGLAFLYLRGGQHQEAIRHLKAFLGNAPTGEEAREHLQHARATLAELTGEGLTDGSAGGD
jgi:tetratricopeptide (TPR) repeat protein